MQGICTPECYINVRDLRFVLFLTIAGRDGDGPVSRIAYRIGILGRGVAWSGRPAYWRIFEPAVSLMSPAGRTISTDDGMAIQLQLNVRQVGSYLST